MSKGNSGHFRGANGNSGAEAIPPHFVNGHVTYEGIAAHREEFINKSVEQIADMLRQNGYELNLRGSIHAGSTAQVLEITNPTRERNIKQVQVSPDGSSRHGSIPYVKISTSNEGKIKILDGTPETYQTAGNERARLIFRRD